MKLLVVASEPIDGDAVDMITRDVDPDEVRVIAPTLTGSALRYWLNDTDDAIARSAQVLGDSLQKLSEAELEASVAPVTDDEVAVTIDDALREFDPDRVVVIKHGPSDEAYREDQIVEQIEDQTDAPVAVIEAPAGD